MSCISSLDCTCFDMFVYRRTEIAFCFVLQGKLGVILVFTYTVMCFVYWWNVRFDWCLCCWCTTCAHSCSQFTRVHIWLTDQSMHFIPRNIPALKHLNKFHYGSLCRGRGLLEAVVPPLVKDISCKYAQFHLNSNTGHFWTTLWHTHTTPLWGKK